MSSLHQWKLPGAWEFNEVPSSALANGKTTRLPQRSMLPTTVFTVVKADHPGLFMNSQLPTMALQVSVNLPSVITLSLSGCRDTKHRCL